MLVKNNVNPEGAVVTKPTDDKKLHYRSNDEVNNVEDNVSAIEYIVKRNTSNDIESSANDLDDCL